MNKCLYPGCGYTSTENRHKHISSYGVVSWVEMRRPVEIGSMAISEKDYNQQKRQSGAMSDQ